jgi:hypothetical protein
MFTPRTPNGRIDMSFDPGQIHRPPRLAPLTPIPAQPPLRVPPPVHEPQRDEPAPPVRA